MNRRYVASLAVVAVLTLAVGLFVRHWLRPAEPAAAVAPPSDAAAFQQLSLEGQVRRLSSFLNERATDVASLVEYVPASQASGLRWHAGDTLVTTFADRPVAMLRVPRADTTRTPLIGPSDSLRGEWALIVGRRRDGGVVSTAGVIGGQVPTTCNERAMNEFVIGVAISDGFAGAGLFDLAGRVIGMVAHCGDRLIALPANEMMRVTALYSLGNALLGRFGVTARSLDATARSYFGADSGLLATAVSDRSPADLAGWRPGDVIVSIDGVAIDTTVPPAVLDSVAAADSHVVVIRREGMLRVTYLASSGRQARKAADGTGLGLTIGRPAAPGIVIDDVQPGSPADSAGLRTGDRLLRVGRVTVTTPAAGRRVLDRVRDADSLTFIIFRRDSVSRGVWLRR